MRYQVLITPAAKLRILEQAEYIATEQGEPDRAQAWIERIFDKVTELEELPRRYSLAAEDALATYEIRRLPIGQFMLFFTLQQGGAHRIF